MIVCPLCGSGVSQVICDCSDAPYRPDTLNTLAGRIRRCADCQFLYKETTQQSLDALEQIYQYTVQDTQAYFAPTLKGYDENSAEIRLYSRILGQVRERIGPPADDDDEQHLLDVGCGTGALLDRSRAFGFTPHGVELNPHFAEYAREAFDVPVVAGELSLEHFDSGQFTVITMMDLIEHVPNPSELLGVAWQLLRPGGWLVIYTPNHRSLIAQLSLALHRLTGGRFSRPAYIIFGTNHVCFFDHQTLPAVLQRAAYTVEAMWRIKYDPAHEGEVPSRSLLAAGLRTLEAIAQPIGLPYRLLAFARKPTQPDQEGQR
jgi:2-polyprenyl-3-methyl-5-hydroxy-6-metoxy-1,4-benzoquinol methylase